VSSKAVRSWRVGAKSIPGTLPNKEQVCRKIIDYGILGLIVFSPLPAASVYEWSVLVIELAVLVMFGAYVLLKEESGKNDLLSASLKWPKILFVGFFLFLAVQMLPLPKALVKFFSPGSYAFQEKYLPDFTNLKLIEFSLIPAHTLRTSLEILSYFLLGFLIVKTVTRRRQIIRIFAVLIGMGVFQALYGLFELYNKNPRILFYEKIYHLDSATGTFVNRNHFSGYLEMVIPLAVGLAIAGINLPSLMELKWKDRLLRLSEKRQSISLIVSSGLIVMAVAVVFSRSRSGLFLLVFSFILFFGFMLGLMRRSKGSPWTGS
jgi:hypothetical protein